jgi:hypothetical protein
MTLGFFVASLVGCPLLKPVLWIRIRRFRLFLGFPDQHPDPLVTSTDPDPDPSIMISTVL